MNFKDSLHISISSFELKLDELTYLKVKAYDELADYCYSNYKRGDYRVVLGRINDNNEIELELIK